MHDNNVKKDKLQELWDKAVEKRKYGVDLEFILRAFYPTYNDYVCLHWLNNEFNGIIK